tara:strand:+ start:820 stop:1137 length:318 start_codon:yes stop_codon:yes gene_type:complete
MVVGIKKTFYLVRVVGHSMSPTYQNGDLLLFRRSRSIKVNDVVFALVKIKTINEPIKVVKRVSQFDGQEFKLIGDNTTESLDSRNEEFGLVYHNNIIGKLIAKLD